MKPPPKTFVAWLKDFLGFSCLVLEQAQALDFSYFYVLDFLKNPT